MATSLLSRLASLFPGYRGTPTVPPPATDRFALLKRVKDQLENTPRRSPPSSDEKVPTNYHGGIAGKVWFLPYSDTTTKDTPEVRAAMRLMRRDGYVKAAWEPQILTVASEDWQVQPSEAGNPYSEEQANFCKTVVEDYLDGGIVSLVRAVCAPFGSDGFSLAEKVAGPAVRGRLEKKIVFNALKARDVDSSNVRLQGDRFGNVTGVQSMRGAGQEIFPITDFVYSRYMTVFDEPMGEAAFRPAYGPYWMRDTVRKLRAIHCEKKMAGMLVGTYQADDDKGPLESALRAAKSATWMSIPEGTRVEAVQLSTASEPDYKSFDESLRDEIVTSIAFATLQIIQGNVPDARGDTKTQKAMADLGPWLLMVLVSEAANKQIFPDLIDWNFPYPAGGSYPKLTFGAVSNSELLELLQLVQGAQQLGLKPSRKHYAKALSIQEADKNDPEDSLESPQPGGMGMPGMPGDPFGGGGGGFPPDPMGGDPAQLPPGDPSGGGGFQQFGEGVWFEFRDPVKWERQGNGKWRSSGGRVLSDEAYQRHLQRVGNRTKRQAKATTPASVAPTIAPRPEPKPEAPAGVEAASPARGEPDTPSSIRRGVRDKVASAARAGKAIGGRVGRGSVAAASAADRLAAGISRTTVMGARKLAEAATSLGSAIKSVGWLDTATLGLGNLLESKGRRARIRMQTIEAGFRKGFFSGKKRLVREVARVAQWHYKESARKYGKVLGFAVEATMQGWTLGKAAVIGGVGLAVAGAIGTASGAGAALGAMWAGGKVAKYVQKAFGIGAKPLVRNVVENVAGGVGQAFRGKSDPKLGPRERNARAPGRVAQPLDWAEGLSDKKLQKALSGKGVALWYVTGDRRKSGSGRGGKITAQQAAQWVVSKREVEAADREGRKPALPPGDEEIVRRAIQIQTDGAVAKGGMVSGRSSAIRTARSAAAGPGDLYPGPGVERSRSRRFAEAIDADPEDLVADLRAAIDDAYAVMGLPPCEATDEELRGSLAVTLSLMNQEGDRAEAFAEADYETFAFQAARTRKQTLKAVGTGSDQGKTLYGQAARDALARESGSSRRQTAPRNVKYDITDPEGNVTSKRERGVSPERARAMAIAAKVAALEGGSGGERPTEVKVTKQAKPRKKPTTQEVEALAPKVKAGDPQATAELQTHAATTVTEAATELANAPADAPAKIAAAFQAANARAGTTVGSRAKVMPTRLERAHKATVNFLTGMVGETAEGISGKVGSFVNWLGKQAAGTVRATVQGLARFAHFAGKAAWATTKGAARLAGRIAGSDTVKPFLYWAGAVAAGTAVIVAPVLAVNYGLIHWTAAVAAGPLAVAGVVKLGRKLGRKAADAGMTMTGNGTLVNMPPVEKHAERVGRGCVTKFADAKDVALAGPDGQRANLLLSHAQTDVTRMFADRCRTATERMLASENPGAATVLFNDDELSEIASGLGRVIATADLLGRARIRRRAEMAERLATGSTFAEVAADDPFHDFAEPIPPLSPLKAIEYVRTRVPAVDPGPDRYGSRLDRHATTLAIASDEVLLDKIKQAIAAELEGKGDATPDIDAILRAAGVSPDEPQYPSMIARTNAMLAYTTGAADEMATPEMREAFPAWRYEGILDSRTGDDHRPQIGKYYPSSRNFAEVRGQRIWNCRCNFSPIHRSMMDGVRVEGG